MARDQWMPEGPLTDGTTALAWQRHIQILLSSISTEELNVESNKALGRPVNESELELAVIRERMDDAMRTLRRKLHNERGMPHEDIDLWFSRLGEAYEEYLEAGRSLFFLPLQDLGVKVDVPDELMRLQYIEKQYNAMMSVDTGLLFMFSGMKMTLKRYPGEDINVPLQWRDAPRVSRLARKPPGLSLC
jgi:hypothetical protein